MKQLTLLYSEQCGYCKKAKMLLNRALSTHPEFHPLDVRFVSERSKEAAPLTHQFVPAFYCGDTLFFEGNPSMDIVVSALFDCLENESSKKADRPDVS